MTDTLQNMSFKHDNIPHVEYVIFNLLIRRNVFIYSSYSRDDVKIERQTKMRWRSIHCMLILEQVMVKCILQLYGINQPRNEWGYLWYVHSLYNLNM